MAEENLKEQEQNLKPPEPEQAPRPPQDNTKSAIEALLFISERPLVIDQIKKIFGHLTAEQIRRIIEELKSEYESSNRGIRIYEVAGGFQMIAAPDFATFLRKLNKEQRSDRLSKPALETLAIIAYKQPMTKTEIQTLRSVNIDGVMKTLADKNLIRIAGRKQAPGRPKVYATTRQFLEYFGLNSLEDLPKLEKENFSETLAKEEAKVKGEETDGTEKPAQPN
ncbi:MAG: SMC-Scp complex subunit ScpB [Candidatus Omnitrophica bacterium]|nr:SMC-Scp complex subunit ScpB [Candidatus Omnitrophota bacterium]